MPFGAVGEGEDFVAIFGHEDGVFAVATGGAVGEDDGPVVAGLFADVIIRFAETGHGFDTDAVAGL